MLISKRRLQWGVIFLLACLCAVLVRPVRSWVDQVLIGRAIDPQLAVRELHFHTRTSVVEARDLNWGGVENDRSFGIRARRGWFAVDGEAILDRRFCLPVAILEDAELHLENYDLRDPAGGSVWQQELAERVAQLDWQEIQQHFSSLLATEDLTQTWRERVDRWVNRSRLILARVQMAPEAPDSLKNPLRAEDRLRQRIRRLDSLTTEHSTLTDQFVEIEKLLQAEANQLEELYQRDIELLSSMRWTQNGKLVDAELVREATESMTHQVARQVWQSVADFAEVSDMVAHAVAGDEPRSYDRDVRSANRNSPSFELAELKARGVFTHNQLDTPFSVNGQFSAEKDRDSCGAFSAAWRYHFMHGDLVVRVVVSADSRGANQIQLGAVPAQDTDPEAWLDASGDADGNAPLALSDDASSLELGIRSDGEQLEGVLVFGIDALEGLEGKPIEVIRSAMASGDPADPATIEMQLAGSWKQPELKLDGEYPSWLLSAVEQALAGQLEPTEMATEARLRTEFETRLGALRVLVASASQAGQVEMQNHHQQLVAERERFQFSLDEIGTEFARRPGDALNR